MKWKQRIASGFLAGALCLSSLTAAGQEERTEALEKDARMEEAAGEETEVIEVTDLASLQEAASKITDGDDLAGIEKSASPWRSKRLLVKSRKAFDPMGAESVISGYEDMHILTFENEKAARQAYDSLQSVPGLCVEADIPYDGAANMTEEEKKEPKGTSEPGAGKLSATCEEAGGRKLEKSAGPGAGKPSAASKEEGKTEPEESGRDIRVAVIDSGYDLRSYGDGRLADGCDLTGSGSIQDENGHGTAMANLILEHAPDNVKVMPVKAADENGRSSSLKLYLGIRYAAEHHADIVNISMSAYKAANAEVIHAAIGEARKAGIFVVASAGNAGRNVSDFSPANAPDAIAVSAVTADGAFAEYSNCGEDVDYCSYGTMQISGLYGKTESQEGTSVSAALVSAAIAAAKSCRNEASYPELVGFLDSQAKDLGEPGPDRLYGRGFLSPKQVTAWEPDQKGRLPEILTCDWKSMPLEEWNHVIGCATNLERRVFLEELDAKELEMLLSMGSLFSERVIYSENEYDAQGDTEETFRMQGTLYDIVMSEAVSDEYEVQAQKYHVFFYGSNNGTRSCIKLDTEANTKDAVIYCWMKDRSTDDQNSGKYGLTFAAGSSAYDFSSCTHKIENCDRADSGNPVVWRLKIRNVKVSKPADMTVDYEPGLWNKSDYKLVGTAESGHKAPYWYVYHYQVKPASDAARERAYGNGAYHGGFWDLAHASGKKCGSVKVTTAVDIGSADLKAVDHAEGIAYRLPLAAHLTSKKTKTVKDAAATCTKEGAYHEEITHSCSACDTSWKTQGASGRIARLAHAYAGRYGENNGIANGMYWEECVRSCGGTDVNGESWQRNAKYLQPLSYYEMDANGAYHMDAPSGTVRETAYYAPGAAVPAFSRTPSEEFLTGSQAEFASFAHAYRHILKIPRKQYKVNYDGNGAAGGTTESQAPYCGQIFDLRPNGFVRAGYEFTGWSKSPGGPAMEGSSVKNLSLVHNASVTLYAQWRPLKYKIAFDSQGANLSEGTRQAYAQYATGYYEDAALTRQFADGKIEIPQKERNDAALTGGRRREKFTGYYTEKGKAGERVADEDGSLIANIDGKGDYLYFKEDKTVYAGWEDMFAVQFSANLPEEELAFLRRGESGATYSEPVRCPFTRWKEKGGGITVGFGEAVVQNPKLAKIYRLKGWSLTPQIKGEDEIVLSKDKAACTFHKDEDVTLYAQWDTSVVIAYAGNGQTKGENFLEEIEKITDSYAFRKNLFERAVQKPAKDIATGQKADASGKPFTETVACSFSGWSMQREHDGQGARELFREQDGARRLYELVLKAQAADGEKNGEGLTFGAPAPGYGEYEKKYAEDVPFLTLFAVWDEYPQIHAADLYLPLEDAEKGRLTEEYLLGLAVATDEELKSPENADGLMPSGIDRDRQTSFTILDYQASDFTAAKEAMSVTITYRAKDAAGNVSTKRICVYLADTSGEERDTGRARFISAEHADTLAENSVWRTGEHARKLERALSNKKKGEKYTEVTPAQRALGVLPVKKPGSGTWERVKEIWEFTHAQVLMIQDYLEESGAGEDPSEFLEKFASCKKQ